MLVITQEEAQLIKKKFPNEHIAMTGKNKKSNRKRYYVSENKWVVNYLRQIRKR